MKKTTKVICILGAVLALLCAAALLIVKLRATCVHRLEGCCCSSKKN